eukprot:g5281.t1
MMANSDGNVPLGMNEGDEKTSEDEATATINVADMAPLCIDILDTITTSQLQNGLRHGDYLRYRRYCARQLRRLRKSLGISHGKGRVFQQKKITPEDSVESRFLLIPLVNAERAWAYAMESKEKAEDLKDEDDEDGMNPRKRHIMLRKLRKAVRWSSELSQLCAKRGDERTTKEAKAYAAYLAGELDVEMGRWGSGVSNFSIADKNFSALVDHKSTSVSSKDLVAERAKKSHKAMEYCRHMAARLGDAIPDEVEDALEENVVDEGAVLREAAKTFMQDSGKLDSVTPRRYLQDRLDEITTPAENAEAAQDSITPFRVHSLRPRYKAVECKPCLFDLAFTTIERPTLMHRIDKAKRKEAVARRQSYEDEEEDDDDFDSAEDEEIDVDEGG